MTEKLNITIYAILFGLTAPLMTVSGAIFTTDPIKVAWFLRDFVNNGANWQMIYGTLLVYSLVFLVFFVHRLKENQFYDNKPILEIVGHAILLAFLANIVLIATIILILAFGGAKIKFDLFLLGLNTPR